MKTFYQVSKFKNGNRSYTGKIQAIEKPKNCTNYNWYNNEFEAMEQNKFQNL